MSIYDSSQIGTSSNQIIFNQNTVFPVFRVISRRPQQRQIRDLDIPVPFENGISDFETLIGKSAYVIQGVMYPGGESEYDAGLVKLRKLASLDISQADVLSDEGYVPYQFSEFERDKIIYMKVLYVDIPEDTRKGLVQPFTLVCKIKDPVIYGATLKQADTSNADFTTATGTAIYPFSYPIVLGASTASVSVDANNIGDLPVYPVSINIHGPVNVPKITNTTTGEYIEVDVNLGSTSNELVIAYDKDSLTVELDGVSVLNKVSATSTYFKVPPGSNIFQLTGSSISSSAYATVSYRDGWSLG
jgi:hypothetical protein